MRQRICIPVYEAQLVDGFYRQCDLGHVEARDVLGEDLVLDEHGHEVTTRKKLHEHVEEGVVLEGRVQLDDPWTVGFGENVTL
jgi:hypothetical protein